MLPPQRSANPESWRALYETAVAAGGGWIGWYNRIVPLVDSPVGPVVVRVPLTDTTAPADVRRWPGHAVMAAAGRYVRVPKVLHVSTDPPYQVHQFIRGPLLHNLAPPGTSMPRGVIVQIADLLTRLTEVPASVLPPRPPGWTARTDTVGFTMRMAAQAEMWHQRSIRAGLGALYSRLGIPCHPFAVVRPRLADLTPRRLVLIHTDIHRRNVILADPRGDCVWLDWESATWGDPLCDLVSHLLKTYYKPPERAELLKRWQAVMPPDCITGWETDLPSYVMYEQIRSTVAFADRVGRLVREPYPAPDSPGALVARLARQLTRAHRHWYGARRVVTAGEVSNALAWWARQAVPR